MINALEIIEKFPSPEESNKLSDKEFYNRLFKLKQLLRKEENNVNKIKILYVGNKHPIWQVRLEILEVAFIWANNNIKEAKQFVFDMTHDPVDTLAFQAITRAGQLGDIEVVKDLVRISGLPSTFMKPDAKRKPVGIGAALTKNAIIQLFGSSEIHKLQERENQFLEPFRKIIEENDRKPNLTNMVKIPAGECTIGTHERDDFLFYYKDYIPKQKVYVEEFYIDRYPITNEEYSEFLEYTFSKGHFYCHPDEEVNKDHTPAHLRDIRFNRPNLPVVGVDWYDAYAYAKWAGKDLPTEIQWEKAARGNDEREYPWGNEWDSELANHFERAFNTQFQNIQQWEKILIGFSEIYPSITTIPSNTLPKGNSPYGVSDMSGNVWEWTKTNFFSRQDMDPFFKKREFKEFMNRPAAFPVIKGGCFTSLSDMLKTFYRGKDLLVDRHCEIGFRCVANKK